MPNLPKAVVEISRFLSSSLCTCQRYVHIANKRTPVVAGGAEWELSPLLTANLVPTTGTENSTAKQVLPMQHRERHHLTLKGRA